MLYPTINKITKLKFNRYQISVATAKCARLITYEYVRERHIAEKAALGVKDADKTADNIVNPDYRDRKAVKIAIDKIESGEYVIVDRDEEGAMTFGEHAGVFASAHQAGAAPDAKAEPAADAAEAEKPEEEAADAEKVNA